jgi:hypothetical protein
MKPASVIAVDILFDASCDGLRGIKKMETESTMLDALPFASSTRPNPCLDFEIQYFDSTKKKQALSPAFVCPYFCTLIFDGIKK